MQNFRACETEIFQQIARVFGQAAAMCVHVPDRDFARDPRIKHRKCGIEDAQF